MARANIIVVNYARRGSEWPFAEFITVPSDLLSRAAAKQHSPFNLAKVFRIVGLGLARRAGSEKSPVRPLTVVPSRSTGLASKGTDSFD